MFCDPALAARVDAAEAALCAAVARHAPSPSIVPIGGGLAVLSRAGSPVNKVAGAGFTGALDEAALETVEATWRARDQPVRFEVATLADPAIHRQLTSRGYHLEGFEHVLGRPITAADATASPAPRVTIERMTAATAPVWLELALEGFGAGDGTGAEADDGFAADVLRQVFTDFAGVDELRGYIARVDGEPAGSASMRLDGGVAQLAGASTIPRFRRRGVQRSLLTARLADAAAAAADLAIVTTAPGSQSQANVGRLGFDLLYARAILVR
jgi:hypothetical protein